jgi:hypothetical protein
MGKKHTNPLYFFILILLLFPKIGKAQNHDNNWFFSNSIGISFGTGNPAFVSGGVMTQAEGNATISDPSGNLLFYTNGYKIWNRNHQVMPNGLLNASAYSGMEPAQGYLIVPMPSSNNLYYLFSVPDWYSNNGLRYSVIDMSLNGGLGDIVASQKNIFVHDHIREQISATYHFNGRDIWIVCHHSDNGATPGYGNPYTPGPNYNNSNKFVAFLLTPSGLNTTPVVSTSGSLHNGSNRYGYLRFSKNGSTLASALGGGANSLEIFNFNNQTGIVSNAQTIETSGEPYSYICEFSPSGSVLYMTVVTGSGTIRSYDITSGVGSTIRASKLSFGVSSDLLLGKNDKIYGHWTGSYLSEINNPNNRSSPSFVQNAVAIGSQTVTSNLPNFIKPLVCPSILISGLPSSSLYVSGTPITLSGQPGGEIFSGPGMSAGGIFNPTSAGVGTHTITYTVSGLIACPNTATATITVVPCPPITISGLPPVICPGTQTINLIGSPTPGAFSGTGITSGTIFDPAAAGAGTHTITYTISGYGNCPNTVTQKTLVLPPATYRDSVISATAITYSDVWPLDFNSTSQKEEFNKNELWNGSKGIWKQEESYIYTDRRTPTIPTAPVNLRTDGVMNDVPMFNWASALNGGCAPNWRLVNTITKYSPYSFETENKDILNIHATALYAYQGNLTTAVAANAKTSEIAFEGFEEYVPNAAVTSANLSTGNLTFYTQAPASYPSVYKEFEVESATDNALTINFPFANSSELQGKTIKVFGADFDKYNNKTVHGDFPVTVIAPGLDAAHTIITLNPSIFLHTGIWKGKISVPYPLQTPVVTGSSNLSISGLKGHTGKNSLKATALAEMEQISLSLIPADTFILSCWVSLDNIDNYTFRDIATNARGISINFLNAAGTQIGTSALMQPSQIGPVIEGWQKIEQEFIVPAGTKRIVLQLKPGPVATYFDDIRIFPLHSNIQTYVYNKDNLKLRAVLDNNNYASLYYYDEQGSLYMVKKETERGIQTIQEGMYHPQEKQ